MQKVQLNSKQVCAVRGALYAAANSLYELKQKATEPSRRDKYEAEGDELYTLAEQLKNVNSLEGN